MWLWLAFALILLDLAGFVLVVGRGNRLLGRAVLAVAAASAVVVEVLIRLDVISVSQGTELMNWAVLLLIAVSAAFLPGWMRKS